MILDQVAVQVGVLQCQNLCFVSLRHNNESKLKYDAKFLQAFCIACMY